MAKYLFWIFVALIIVAAGIYILNNEPENSAITGATAQNLTGNSENVKTFSLTGENFRFYLNGVENPELKVKQGDRVRIQFTSNEGFHDWVLDEFGARTQQIGEGQTTSVEFVADRKGTFEYYCSVGGHRAMGMKGFFVVE